MAPGGGVSCRQLLTESTLLALAGAVVGLAIAGLTMDLLVTLADQFTTRSQEISLNGVVLLFTLGIATLTGVLVGAIPSLPGRVSLSSVMQEGSRTVAGGRGSLRSALIVAQVAVSFVLLIGAGLMLRSLLHLQAVDPGIQTESVLSMRVALNFTKYKTPAQRGQFLTQLVERLREIPGVRSVGGAGTFPLNEGGRFFTGVRVEGQPEVEPTRLPRAEFQRLARVLPDSRDSSPQGTVVRRTRHHRARERGRHQRIDGAALLSELDPIGARISNNNGQTWVTIVGVVGDVRQHARVAAVRHVVPSARPDAAPDRDVSRADVGGACTPRAADARRRPRAGREPAGDQFRTLDEVRSQSLSAPRLTTTLMAVFAGIALLITAAGLAGVIAFSVNQRTQEFGVRMALGASRGSVLRMVLSQALRLV